MNASSRRLYRFRLPLVAPDVAAGGVQAPRVLREGGGVDDTEGEKRSAAEAAAALVEDGMVVGLGTGSTVAYLLPALGVRRLDISCVATSPATESLARAEGLAVGPFERIDRLDMAIDGADQVDPGGWLVKGGGGAHTREKIVAAAADRFIVIVSSNKLVPRLSSPVPLELMAFGLDSVLRSLPDVDLRRVPRTPDGGVLADYRGALDDPARWAQRFSATPGIVEHGLFPPSMVSLVVVGRDDRVESFRPAV
jgi:ribose 5-phosphate isomerase A